MFNNRSHLVAALNKRFEQQYVLENAWPPLLPDPHERYKKFREALHHLANNTVCACCACIFHNPAETCSIELDNSILSLLRVDPSLVPYDFTTGFEILDENNILISNGIRSVQEPSRNRSRPGQVIIDSISVPAMSEPAQIGS